MIVIRSSSIYLKFLLDFGWLLLAYLKANVVMLCECISCSKGPEVEFCHFEKFSYMDLMLTVFVFVELHIDPSTQKSSCT